MMPQRKTGSGVELRATDLQREIERLNNELQDRRRSAKPLPLAVIQAYRALIQRQYDQLDRLAQR